MLDDIGKAWFALIKSMCTYEEMKQILQLNIRICVIHCLKKYPDIHLLIRSQMDAKYEKRKLGRAGS